MNSVTRHLGTQNICATLLAMRSGKKEVLLLVEGGDDIALLSSIFKLPRSNFLACGGKEPIMELFSMVPRRGLDAGTVLVRDRDHDQVLSSRKDGILLLVSDLYDMEMHLLTGRPFCRVFEEFARPENLEKDQMAVQAKLIEVASKIGALRLVSTRNGLNLKFQDLNLSFVDHKTLEVDEEKLVRVVLQRSSADMKCLPDLLAQLRDVLDKNNPIDLTSGKDLLRIMHIAFYRHFRYCRKSAECQPDVLARMLRVSAVLDDFREMSLVVELRKALPGIPFKWAGITI